MKIQEWFVRANLVHVDYPHTPGSLYDCPGCELGPCTCEPGDAGCASDNCTISEEIEEARTS